MNNFKKGHLLLFFLLFRWEQGFTGESLNDLVSSSPCEQLMMCFSFSSHSPQFPVHTFKRLVKLWCKVLGEKFDLLLSCLKRGKADSDDECACRAGICWSCVHTPPAAPKAPCFPEGETGRGGQRSWCTAHFIREHVCSVPPIHTELLHVMPSLQARKWKLTKLNHTVGTQSSWTSNSKLALSLTPSLSLSSLPTALPPSLPASLPPSFLPFVLVFQWHAILDQWKNTSTWNLYKDAYLHFPFIISKSTSYHDLNVPLKLRINHCSQA